jgi:hypothetical protein
MCGAIPPTPKYAFLEWCSVEAQGHRHTYNVKGNDKVVLVLFLTEHHAMKAY